MKHSVKRVAAIHDLSGFGRASLTAIIPILSSMGVQVCPLPTAILSNHTGGFDTFSFVDFTDHMQDYIDHWKELNIDFDCIYSGFLGSERQIEIVSGFIDDFGTEDNMVVIDPVLGDNGNLYSTMDQGLVEGMKRLVTKADIITPNFTEVSLLLGEEYKQTTTDEEIKEWVKRLSDMGPDIIVVTSVPDKEKDKEIENRVRDNGSGGFPAADPGLAEIVRSFEDNIGSFPPAAKDSLLQWRQIFTDDLILLAIKKAALSGVHKWNYVNGILKAWKNEGVKTLGDVQARDQRRKPPAGQQPKRSAADDYDEIFGELLGGSTT